MTCVSPRACPAAFERYLRPIDDGLEALPVVTLTAAEVVDVAAGRFVRPAAGLPAGVTDQPLRLLDPGGRLVAIGLRTGPRVAPTKVLIELPSQPAPIEAGEGERA